jgi:thioredoxin reductase (NADPH)
MRLNCFDGEIYKFSGGKMTQSKNQTKRDALTERRKGEEEKRRKGEEEKGRRGEDEKRRKGRNQSAKEKISSSHLLPFSLSPSPQWDVIVIGGGAAGMSAALWCEELGLRVLLLEAGGELGGQLLRVYNPIKNHLGAETENGREMRDLFLAQIKKRKFKIRRRAEVAEVDLQNKSVVTTTGETFAARFLIIATGVSRRRLNVEGEEKFAGRGILESGKRDAEKARGKAVCIVGGGDAALENALILTETAAKVYLVHRRRRFRARAEFLEPALKNPKIEIMTESVVKKIGGEKTVETIEIENLKTKKSQTFPVEAVLIRAGVQPNTEIFRGKLKLDKQGYIKINRDCATNIKNVFAVGDVASPLAPTVSTAVGTGAAAAKAIYSGFIS